MDKDFPTSEYIANVIHGIFEYTDDRKITHKTTSLDWEYNPKPNVIYDIRVIFELWLRNQLKRYDKVKEVVEPFMKSKKMIQPAEKSDFMIWFVNKALETNDYFSVKIKDYHFIEYHEERMMEMNKHLKWRELYEELSAEGYIKSSLETFNHVMEFKHPPDDKEKVLWLKQKADALCFQKEFNFLMPQFNYCFRSKNDKPFHENQRLDTGRKEQLPSIIDKYNRLLDE